MTTLINTPLQSLLLLVLPGVGILLSWLIVRYLIRDDISHGVTRVLYAISRNRSRIKFHNVYSSILTSSITIGFGGSVGAESPVVMTGAAIGSNIGRFLRMDSKMLTLMVGCGAAAGISAIFKAPLAGMVFTLEVLLLDLTMSSIVPLLVSAVSATMVSHFLLGDAALFHFVYVVPFDLKKTIFYIILGLFTGFISLYFTHTAIALEGRFKKMRSPLIRLIVGGSVLGILIYLFPALYGEGYNSIQALFRDDPAALFSTGPLAGLIENHYVLLGALFALFMLKVVAMAATTGPGGVGGSFAPTLFVGAVSGYFLAQVLNDLFDAGVGDGNFVLVGMAGAMAGVMHAPLLGIFLIAELTDGYVLLMPLMITATVSYITISTFEKHSIYTSRLAASGDLITHHKDRAVLTMMRLASVIEKDLTAVSPDATLGQLVHVVAHSQRNIFPVLDKDGVLLGIVLLDDIRRVMFDADKYDQFTVRDFMVRPPGIIEINDPMSDVMQNFEKTNAWNLPVVDKGRYVGFVSKAKIFSAYRNLLVQFSNE